MTFFLDFCRFLDLLTFFFWQFLDYFNFFFGIFWTFIDFLGFFNDFLIFLDFSLDFWMFWNFWSFLIFLDFSFFFGIPFKITYVTIKSYLGYYWALKIAKNGPKQHNKHFFCPKGKKSLGQKSKPSAEARSRPA